MKRKIISLLLVLSMTAVMLAGCGGSKNAASENAAGGDTDVSAVNDTDANAGTAEIGEYPVIRINYAAVGNPTDEQVIEDALNEILREKAGAEVDLIGIAFGNWTSQLNLMLVGGDNALDLFSSFWYTSTSNLAANGQAIAMDELLESDGQGIKEIYAGLEEYMDCGRVDGKLYGIPSITAWSCENMYIARKSTSDAAGVDFSKVHDLATMTDAMIAMKEASPDKYFIPGSTDPYWMPKDIDYFGDSNFLGVLTDPLNSTTVENYYESEYFKNFLEYVKIWKEHDLISPDPLSNGNPTLSNLQLGVVDGTTGYNWDAQVAVASNSVNFNMDLVGAAVTKPLATSSDVSTYMWHISPFCKNPDAAMRVLNVLYTDPDASMLIANGIEGLEYVLDENGKMSYPEGKAMMDIGWPASSMAYWPNVTLCKTWSFETDDIYEQMKDKIRNVDKSLALGFLFDSGPVTDQMTACANVVSQYYVPLMYGEVDIDSALPEFQNALKAAGIDEIIAEKQRQLDTWLASK